MPLARAALVRTAFKPRTVAMARGSCLTRTPFVRSTATTGGSGTTRAQRLTTRQRSTTKVDRQLWTRMANTVGCIACHLDGHANPLVSIHHIDGRTKPGCHERVLPLCAGHHQAATGEDKSLIAVHPDKARFEQRYGPQAGLLELVHQLLAGHCRAA